MASRTSALDASTKQNDAVQRRSVAVASLSVWRRSSRWSSRCSASELRGKAREFHCSQEQIRVKVEKQRQTE